MLEEIFRLRPGENFMFSPENPTAAKGAGGTAASSLGPGRKGRPCVTVEPGADLVLAETDRTGIITHIWLTDANTLRGRADCEKVLLRIFYAGSDEPAVEVPMRYFFGDFSNLTESNYGIYSLPAVLDNRGRNFYLPIPFQKGIKIILHNGTEQPFSNVFYQIDGVWLDSLPDDAAFLHAQFNASWPNELGRDHILLEATGRGHFVGGYTYICGWGNYWHGEGEVKMYIDGDSDLPTICGTGTEDYYGSAWCYGTPFNSPFLGLAWWKNQIQQAVAYRWHLQDAVNFRKSIKVTLQCIGYRRGVGLVETRNDVLSVQFCYLQHPAR